MVRLLLSAAFALATHASGPSGAAPDRSARLDQLQARIDALREQVRAALQACPPAPSEAQGSTPSSAPAPPEGTGGSGAAVHDGAEAKRRLDELKSKLDVLQGQLGSAKASPQGKGSADENSAVAQRVVALGGDLEQQLGDLLKKVDAHVAAGGADDAHWRELNGELRDLALLMRAWLVQSASAVSLQVSAMEPRLDARFRTLDRRIALRLQAIEDRIDRGGAPQQAPRTQLNEERNEEERPAPVAEKPSKQNDEEEKPSESDETKPREKSSESSQQKNGEDSGTQAQASSDKNSDEATSSDGSAKPAEGKPPEATAPDAAPAVGGSGEPPQVSEEKPPPSTDTLTRLRSLSELHPLVVEDALPTASTEAHVALASRTDDGRLALVVRPQLEVRLPFRTELRLGADGARVDGRFEGGPFRVALLSQFVESAGARPAVALRLGATAGSPVRSTEGNFALLATEVMDANRVHLNAVWLPSEATPRAWRGVLGLDHAFGDRWLILADALYERRGEEARVGGDVAAAYRFNPHVALRAAVGMVRIGPSLVPQVVLDLDAAD